VCREHCRCSSDPNTAPKTPQKVFRTLTGDGVVRKIRAGTFALRRAIRTPRGRLGDILQQVGQIADLLAQTEVKSLPFRMADFASFGACVFEPVGKSNEWEALLGKIESAQAGFAAEGDGVLAALRLLTEREGPIDTH
jgi:hypothetical protein